MAIRHLNFGVHVDTDVPRHMVRIERQTPTQPDRVDYFAEFELADRWVKSAFGFWDLLEARFAESSDGLYKVPVELSVLNPALRVLSDELDDLIKGLRAEEPLLGEFCQARGCILPTERTVFGYGLCWHHRETLDGYEVLMSAMGWDAVMKESGLPRLTDPPVEEDWNLYLGPGERQVTFPLPTPEPQQFGSGRDYVAERAAFEARNDPVRRRMIRMAKESLARLDRPRDD